MNIRDKTIHSWNKMVNNTPNKKEGNIVILPSE